MSSFESFFSQTLAILERKERQRTAESPRTDKEKEKQETGERKEDDEEAEGEKKTRRETEEEGKRLKRRWQLKKNAFVPEKR